jgi:hypothetical protein
MSRSLLDWTAAWKVTAMAMRRLVLAAALLGCLAGVCVAEYDPRDAVVMLTDKNFEKEVLQSGDYWLVEFYAPWCGGPKDGWMGCPG